MHAPGATRPRRARQPDFHAAVIARQGAAAGTVTEQRRVMGVADPLLARTGVLETRTVPGTADCTFRSQASPQRAVFLALSFCSVLAACSAEAPSGAEASVGLALQLAGPTDPSLGTCGLGSVNSFSIGVPPPSSAASQGTPVISGEDDVRVRCQVTPDAAAPGAYAVNADIYSPLIVFELDSSTSETSAAGSLHFVAETVATDLSTKTCRLGARPAPFSAAPGQVWGSFECMNAVAAEPGVACNVVGLLLLSDCRP